MSDRKLKYFGITIIVLLTLILVKDLTDSEIFITLGKILTPFLYGFIIAYFLDPTIEWLHRKVKKKRLIIILLVYGVLLLMIYWSFKFIMPIIISNLNFFIRDLPNSMNKLMHIIDTKILSNLSPEYATTISLKIRKSLGSIGATNLDIGLLLYYTKYATDFIMNLIIGIVISVYMIKDKVRLTSLFKRLMYSYLDSSFVNSVISFLTELDEVFYRFLIGKVIDSAIMGAIFYVLLFLIQIPYSIIMSIVFGLTNIIPYFGPFLGIITCTMIALIYAPEYTVLIFIMTILLQQFDGFYLGPKILGGRVGLSPFWTMATILIAGGLFGVAGMLLAVPAASVVKTLLNRSMEERLTKKNIFIEHEEQ